MSIAFLKEWELTRERHLATSQFRYHAALWRLAFQGQWLGR
jgi:hypothetical protein